MVRMIERLAGMCGEDLVDVHGVNKYGGHTARVEGARRLTSIGVDMHKVQLLARWASPMILRYAGEAPLDSLTQDYVRA
eukprot:5068872-Amphidinium_carterae.1